MDKGNQRDGLNYGIKKPELILSLKFLKTRRTVVNTTPKVHTTQPQLQLLPVQASYRCLGTLILKPEENITSSPKTLALPD